ncbi:hypothetical protein [Azotobacter salinestris]|uniref:hypothetical protein n=1 Tax=Azotobacter salinestris TaxID=69964 RepID=UPI001FCC0ADC|nr:hypothetical protein [Azotobacter salinestris]
MHGAATDRPAAVVGAELERIVAVAQALVGPEQLFLVRLVGGELLERPPPGAGVEGDHGKARLGQPAGQSAAAGASADDGEIHRLLFRVLAHRHPAAAPEHVQRPAASPARDFQGFEEGIT